MNQDELKQAVAISAIDFVVENEIIGVGTGSTANFFIDELSKIKHKIKAAVASSEATAERLKSHDIPVLDLNQVDRIPVYVDGADEITAQGAMIKGGGGALTREKIIASASERFICIADSSKLVETLGAFPLPIEVIPMAHKTVAQKLALLGGQPILRESSGSPFVTDNGNYILDVSGMKISDPVEMENRINNIVGVVTVGLFAQQGASICLLGTPNGTQKLVFEK